MDINARNITSHNFLGMTLDSKYNTRTLRSMSPQELCDAIREIGNDFDGYVEVTDNGKVVARYTPESGNCEYFGEINNAVFTMPR